MCICWISFVLPEIHQPGGCNVWWLQAICWRQNWISRAMLVLGPYWLGWASTMSHRPGLALLLAGSCAKKLQRHGGAQCRVVPRGIWMLMVIWSWLVWKNRKVIGAPASNREGKLKHLGSHQPVIQRSSMADFPDSPQMLVKFPESYVFCWSNSNVSRSNSGLFFGKSPRCFLKSHLILG